MTAPQYQLSDDVYFCVSDMRIVFLDLRRNKYFCLSRHNSVVANRLLAQVTKPDPKPDTELTYGNTLTVSRDDDDGMNALARALFEGGLLTQGQHRISKNVANPVTAPLDSILKQPQPHWTVRTLPIASFFHAAVVASWKLRWYSLQQTVESVRNRQNGRTPVQQSRHHELYRLVAAFHHLRPYYGRKYLCLYDSLALLEFLARHRLFPQWVFGVTAEPFSAHCWVQDKSCVLNDSVECVRGYTPIMVV